MQNESEPSPIASSTPSPVKDLEYLIQRLIVKYNPLQVFCFHKRVERRAVNGCFLVPVEEEVCNYYLLMVTESPSRIEHAVQDFANAHYNQGAVIILVHGKESIERSINTGHGFFKQVFKHGQLLYNHDGFFQIRSFSEVTDSLSDEVKKSRFKEGVSRAEGFLLGAQECLANRKFNVAAFMLHQSVEQCCIALVSFHMDYRCDIHSLYRLLMLCCCFSDVPYNLFLSNKTSKDPLFSALIESYLKARYVDGFVIQEEDLVKLSERCSGLLEFTKSRVGATN
ncbi:MAG: HEPN domain-containing protein [Bacteroidota bacterium]